MAAGSRAALFGAAQSGQFDAVLVDDLSRLARDYYLMLSVIAELHFEGVSGSMACGGCGATIAQVSGKAGGYYGCLGAAKGACDNRMLVRRKLAEAVILKAVRAQLSQAEHIRYLLERVEGEVTRLYAHIPETVRMKETKLGAEERRLANVSRLHW